MLSCCDADGEILSVLEFFAVGKTFRALFWCAVKGGGHCQCLNISAIFKVHLCRVCLLYTSGLFGAPLKLLPAGQVMPELIQASVALGVLTGIIGSIAVMGRLKSK